MDNGFFTNLGRQLGRATGSAVRQARWRWRILAGTEEEREQAERELGGSLAKQLRAELGVVDAPDDVAWLGEICGRLARQVRNQRLVFGVELVSVPEPSAFALPGGFLFLSRSMLELCLRSPDETAFVIGHEMAHVVRGHAADRLLEASAEKVVTGLLYRTGPLGALVRQFGLGLLTKALSQEQEFEADELGARLARAAGFDPVGGVRLLARLDSERPSPSVLGEYFSSHPPFQERLRRLRLMPTPSPGS